MTTSIEVKPEDRGSCSIKSIVMELHDFLGIGSCFKRP